MKRLLLILAVMLGMEAYAGNYDYLTFETTDGEKSSVKVEGLTITLAGTTLSTGDLSFEVSNLSKMYFSANDETTGITQITLDECDENTVIYDLKGRQLTKEQMKDGVYSIKGTDKTYKIVVR